MEKTKPCALLSAIPFLLISSLLSCEKNEVVVPNGSGLNTPSYTSSLNTFSYNINAQKLSYTHVIPLTFNRNRLQTAAAISNVGQGRAIFAIRDQANAVIHADTFWLSGNYRRLMVIGLPASISITFQDFTGSILFTLMGDSLASGFVLGDFPNSRGSQWKYFVFDNLSQQSDTLVVSVLGDTLIPLINRTCTIWQFAYLHRVHAEYVSIIADTLRFYQAPLFENNKYVFPLEVGKGWRGDDWSDTSTVISTESVSVPAGSFSNGFLVKLINWTPIQTVDEDHTWIVPIVGIVKLHRRTIDWRIPGGVRPITWHLIQYSLAPYKQATR